MKNQNNDREEFEKKWNSAHNFRRNPESIWSWIQSYTQKKVEEALKKVDFKQVSNPLEEEKYESDKGY